MSQEPLPQYLKRILGQTDAVLIGVGSMVGAGIYSVWSEAALSAGRNLLIGLLLAGLVAWCNAQSTARLAAIYPESGGAYIFGRNQLGPLRGFTAGWGFVVGKIASCAAVALTAGAYLWPGNERATAIGVIIIMTAVNIAGLERTVTATKLLLAVSFGVLILVFVSGWTSPQLDLDGVVPSFDIRTVDSTRHQLYEVVQSAGLLFFAFAGYARIATLGEQIIEPQRTIPRAVSLSLGGVLILYIFIAVTVLAAVPMTDLQTSADPLRQVVASGSFDVLTPLVRFGAGFATLGALLNLIPGISRTALAMARKHDLPTWFAAVDERRNIPLRAEISVGMLAALVVFIFDLRNAISISGVGVLTYYAISNWSALTLASSRLQILTSSVGLTGCILFVVCLPGSAVVTGGSVAAVGLAARAIVQRRSQSRSRSSPRYEQL